MKPIEGLDLTPEEARGVAKYRELVQQRRRAGHLRRFYEEIDRRGELDQETRYKLADSLYRKQQADLALKRSRPQATGE